MLKVRELINKSLGTYFQLFILYELPTFPQNEAVNVIKYSLYIVAFLNLRQKCTVSETFDIFGNV